MRVEPLSTWSVHGYAILTRWCECSLPCLALTSLRPLRTLSVFVCGDRKLKGQALWFFAKVPASSRILFHEVGPRTLRGARGLLKLIDHQARVDESGDDLAKGVIPLVVCCVRAVS